MTPKHTAIIMDGNGRWAEQKGMPRIFGHQNGVRAVKRIVEQENKHKIQIDPNSNKDKVKKQKGGNSFLFFTLPSLSRVTLPSLPLSLIHI